MPSNINRIVFPLYPDFDILDVSGPFAMFSSAGLNPVLAAVEPGLVKCLQGVEFQVPLALTDLSDTDAIWMPGGFGEGFNAQISQDAPMLQWLQAEGPKAGYVCSVCTGAILIAAAGLLKGYTATTHWMFQQSLTMFPGVRLASGYPRYWIDRNRITGGGISSGLDASLATIAVLTNSANAMSAQLINQYAPDPPYNAGSPLTASPEILGAVSNYLGEGAANLEQAVADFLKSEK